MSLPRFEDARRDAYRRLGDTQDVLRGDWDEESRPTVEQSAAVRRARHFISEAKDALNEATTDGNHRKGNKNMNSYTITLVQGPQLDANGVELENPNEDHPVFMRDLLPEDREWAGNQHEKCMRDHSDAWPLITPGDEHPGVDDFLAQRVRENGKLEKDEGYEEEVSLP